ncbi:hypothetical protein QYE76_027433 [Lolium multiflorum]|uniref:F-box domain-containing protein n=1 Tax=Lolium multiflorum TaxID=4521 RepID=A0AAD8QK17_LOLMU|nr:hypothetical protein QYE76_027433 [Lolium multiflorum]
MDLPSHRRRFDNGRKDFVHHPDFPCSAERRDWAALPLDVLWVILSLVPQADVLRGAGLVCASWRRLALDEPLLWRRIDLAADEEDEKPSAAWQAMARAAVRRSAGRCESFRGRVNGKFLMFLAHRAPSLRSLHVTSRFDTPDGKFTRVLAQKLPMLEKLVLSDGLIEPDSFAALVDHCPRLQLLDAYGCRAMYPIGSRLRARLESRIKDLRLPRVTVNCRGMLMMGIRVARRGRSDGLPQLVRL